MSDNSVRTKLRNYIYVTDGYDEVHRMMTGFEVFEKQTEKDLENEEYTPESFAAAVVAAHSSTHLFQHKDEHGNDFYVGVYPLLLGKMGFMFIEYDRNTTHIFRRGVWRQHSRVDKNEVDDLPDIEEKIMTMAFLFNVLALEQTSVNHALNVFRSTRATSHKKKMQHIWNKLLESLDNTRMSSDLLTFQEIEPHAVEPTDMVCGINFKFDDMSNHLKVNILPDRYVALEGFSGEICVHMHVLTHPEIIANAIGLTYAQREDYTEEEREMIPEVPSYYVVPEMFPEIVKSIITSSTYPRPIRNICLRGDSGAGKSEGTYYFGACLTLPRTEMVGSPGLEEFDLTCSVLPKTDDEHVSKLDIANMIRNDLSMEPIDFALIKTVPDVAYEKITGSYREDVSSQECIDALYSKMQKIAMSRPMDPSKYRIVESPFVQALEKGWLIEFMEPNTITKPATLSILNSVMEKGTLLLPTGRVIKRHERCVVVFTMNYSSYAGVRPMNQAVMSRFPIIYDMPFPDLDELIQRVTNNVPDVPANIIKKICEVIIHLRKAHSTIIDSGGSCSVREAMACAQLYRTWNDIKKAFTMGVVSKCSEDRDERTLITESINSILRSS